MIFANALLVVMNIITNKQTILFVELRKDSLSATPQTVRKRHFQAYYNEQSRYRDSTLAHLRPYKFSS